MKAVTMAASLAASCLLALPGLGQAPAAVTYDAPSAGFSLPLAGQLTYAVTAGESTVLNYEGSSTPGGGSAKAYLTQVGGTFGILTGSETHPFSALYGGGLWLYTGQYGQSTYYQSLSVSQQFLFQYWKVLVSDTTRYTPNIALGGVSGVSGVGDVGSGTAGGTGAGLLTPNQNRIDQGAGVSASRPLTGATALELGANYQLTRVTGVSSYGVDSDSLTANGGLNHEINGRTSVDGMYSYAHITQPSTNALTQAHTGTFSLTRSLTARSNVTVSSGPQIIQISLAGLSTTTTTYSAHASYDYSLALSSFGFTFDRGLRNTAQISGAAETLTAGGSYTRTFSPILRGSVTGNYLRTEALPGTGSDSYSGDAVYVTGQVNRSIGRQWSTYVSYTLQKQIISGNVVGLSPLNGAQQTIAAGISFSPLAVMLHGHS